MKYSIALLLPFLTGCSSFMGTKVSSDKSFINDNQTLLVPQAVSVEIVSYPDRTFWDKTTNGPPSIIRDNTLDANSPVLRDKIMLLLHRCRN